MDDTIVWKALADSSRRRILDLLRRGPRTTGDLASAFETSRFAVMKHLAVLEEAGLVLVRRRGRERWNHLNAVPLREAYQRWMQPYAEDAAAALLRLKETVEGTRKEHDMQETAAPTMQTLHLEQEIRVEAPREKVFEALTLRCGEWFTHRIIPGSVVRTEPRVGGLMYEDAGDGRGALWSTITAYDPPRFVRMAGAWGVAGPVQIMVTFRLEEDGDTTVLQSTHHIVGEIDDDAAGVYRSVVSQLGPQLRAYLA